ncbi:hypothetical protein VTP01DRAFT_9813 [Rhizomucor pusillus]|uniref:uncharacterized protein n=1 Tax=Rhizomucor pusillus TaxID=4840 RepID=UPI0037428447
MHQELLTNAYRWTTMDSLCITANAMVGGASYVLPKCQTDDCSPLHRYRVLHKVPVRKSVQLCMPVVADSCTDISF